MVEKLPQPSVGFDNQVASLVLPPLVANVSGELTASTGGNPIGAPRVGGKVTGAYFTLETVGRDDGGDALSLEVDVKINGASCMTTKPKLSFVSGEASEHKTTRISGEAGIVVGVVDPTANTFVAGDSIIYDTTVTRTASPEVEMSNLSVVVEMDPT